MLNLQLQFTRDDKSWNVSIKIDRKMQFSSKIYEIKVASCLIKETRRGSSIFN